MNVHLIAAIGKGGQIGLNGALPWAGLYPEDLRWFRDQTAGGFVVMGHRTYFDVAPRIDDKNDRICVYWNGKVEPKSLLDALKPVRHERTIWIAGGAKTYQAFLPFVTRSFITHLPYDGPADTHMPRLWREP